MEPIELKPVLLGPKDYRLRIHFGSGNLGTTKTDISHEVACRDLYVEVKTEDGWKYVEFHVPWEQMVRTAVAMVKGQP